MSAEQTSSATAPPPVVSTGVTKKVAIGTLCGILVIFLGLELLSLLASQQTERQRREIGMVGGRCETEQRVPGWLQMLAGDNAHSFMDHRVITRIVMSGEKINDTHVAKLPLLPDLRVLELENAPVTSACLESIGRFKTLQSLNLSNTQVTDVTPLAVLPELQVLQLNFSQVRREFLAGLSQLAHLKTLAAGYTQVTDEGVVEIAKCPLLEELSIAGAILSENGLGPLRELSHLRLLVLKDAKFDGKDLENLKVPLPNLEIVK